MVESWNHPLKLETRQRAKGWELETKKTPSNFMSPTLCIKKGSSNCGFRNICIAFHKWPKTQFPFCLYR